MQKNVKKWYDDDLHLALFLHLLHEKYSCLLHFSIILSHSACRAQQCFKQDQKYKTKTKTKTEAGLRPVLS